MSLLKDLGVSMPRRKLNDSVAEHKSRSNISAGVAVVTLSNSRSLDTDTSGDIIQELLEKNGHQVPARKVLPDNLKTLQTALHGLL